MMKKIIILIIAVCVIGCTACGRAKVEELSLQEKEDIKNETADAAEKNENVESLDNMKNQVVNQTNTIEQISDVDIQTEKNEQEDNIALELDNAYITQFSDVNEITYPKFQFEYSDNWEVSEENVTPESEVVILKNSKGTEITYSYLGMKNPGGGSGVTMLRIDVTREADSDFVPGYVQASDYSDLGKFMVAKLNVTGELDMQSDADFADIDGGIAYAVLPESYIGVREDVTDMTYLVDFSYWYAGNVAFVARATEGRFTEEEQKEVIAILSSFRLVE